MAQANPLATVRVPVPWSEVEAAHIPPAIDDLLAGAQARLDAIPSAPRTYAGTLGALDLATMELDYALNLAGHLEAVLGSPALREAYNTVLPKVSAFYSQILLSAPLTSAATAPSSIQRARRAWPRSTSSSRS
jgi:oligopeptidase A